MRAIVILLTSVVIPLGAHDAHGKKSAAPAAAKALKSPLTPEQAKSGDGRDLYSKPARDATDRMGQRVRQRRPG